jgi:hypothetical protein
VLLYSHRCRLTSVCGGLDAPLQTATVSFMVVGMEPLEVGLCLGELCGIILSIVLRR